MVNANEIFNDLTLVARLNQHIEGLANDDAVTLTKETSFKVLAELSAISNPDSRPEAQFDHQRDGFRSTDGSHLPFHLQGDQTFNEASAMARRRQLRHCDSIKDKISFLWQVAQGKKSVEREHDLTHERAQTSGPTDLTIDEQEYSEMMLLIFKVLRDDFVLETARKQIECDWVVDSHHGVDLTFQQFFLAVFELVDVWTCDILEAMYVRFLELLTRRITVRVVVFLDDMKLKLALSDNFDEAVVVKAIPLSTIKKFASVAKVMEGTGVRTVGELAKADPQVVESQRVGYLERNAIPSAKLGADLQQLLSMFREISQQFQQAHYSLQDKILKRVGAQASAGDHPVQGDDALSASFHAGPYRTSHVNAAHPLSAGVASNQQSVVTNPSHPSASHSAAQGALNGLRSAQVSSQVAALDNVRSTQSTAGESWNSSSAGDRAHPATSEGGQRTSDQVSVSHRQRNPDAILATIDSDHESVLHRGFKRINTLHDLSTTESGVIDALKAAFLIEKGISIQRKSDIGDVRDQLVRFGVDADTLGDDAARAKYATLYETFVLRDGENIRSLAQSILAQIKMELAAHGIIVNDEDVEAMYDGFYDSVVAGSGEAIVAEAKSWVNETVASHSFDAYIKHDYHELKSIDEVTHLGDGVDDEEFMSLLSVDPDDDGGDEPGEIAQETQLVKTPSFPSRRPSLNRNASGNPKQKQVQKVLQANAPAQGLQSDSSNHEGEHDRIDSHDDDERVIGADAPGKFDNADLAEEIEQPESAGRSITDSENVIPIAYGDPDDHDRHSLNKSGNPDTQELVCTTSPDVSKSQASDPVSPDEEETVDTRSLGRDGNIDNPSGEDMSSLPDEWRDSKDAAERRGSLVIRADCDSLTDPDADDGLHFHENEVDRGPQGVEYEYDVIEDDKLAAVKDQDPTELPDREPKVPDIVVSGVDSGHHIAVTARYIQLLGLGNVSVLQPEAELVAKLRSPETRRTIDLVCFDIGVDLDDALHKTKQLVALAECPVILFGGDETQPEKSDVVSHLCVREGGALFFATLPIDFAALRIQILSVFEASPHMFVVRHRRPTGLFGVATRLLTNARATNMLDVEGEHPRSVLTPPLAVGSSGAKRKATATMLAPTVIPPLLPIASTRKKEVFSPFRPLRAMDEMPGAELGTPPRFTPVVPSSQSYKVSRKSPRMSAALKRLMK